MTIERLDRNKPPPGYEDCGDARGQAFDEFAIADFWAHYEAHNDPPGVEVWHPTDGRTPEWSLWVNGHHPDGRFATETLARAAAWAWYWRRARLTENIDRCALSAVFPIARTREGSVWPHALTWSDVDADSVAIWIADTHTIPLPKVLYG